MTSPSKDIAEFLDLNGVGILGQTLFYNKMPEGTEPSAVIVDAGGNFSNPLWKRDELILQVVVRGSQNNYDDVYNYAYSIKDRLQGCNPVTINDSLYSLFVLIGDINNIGEDASGRTRLTLRFKVVRENYTEDSRFDF